MGLGVAGLLQASLRRRYYMCEIITEEIILYTRGALKMGSAQGLITTVAGYNTGIQRKCRQRVALGVQETVYTSEAQAWTVALI